MASAYTDAELARLEAVGERRTAEARMDIRQRHLTEFDGGDR
ncbi:hypothetical protein [Halolamina salifodinae]|uniref:Uncharacterized protein n=1 Tax=Halolamina salifodinae TaxID=1202767 RepID=A0A8T4H0A5_9EURY|nr:hypothetical protein [Halolamina salifodinae]MBP1987214.1 hypothetical protein [Halolamina salifodinae]